MTRSSNVVLRPPSRTLTGAYFPVPVLQPMPRHTISIVSSAVDEALFAMIELMGSSVGGLKIRKTLNLIFKYKEFTFYHFQNLAIYTYCNLDKCFSLYCTSKQCTTTLTTDVHIISFEFLSPHFYHFTKLF